MQSAYIISIHYLQGFVNLKAVYTIFPVKQKRHGKKPHLLSCKLIIQFFRHGILRRRHREVRCNGGSTGFRI